MYMFISVESLPESGYYNPDYKYLGARALPSPSGDSVILQSQEYLYQFTCTSSGCTWSEMVQKLAAPIRGGVMTYLPEGYKPQC